MSERKHPTAVQRPDRSKFPPAIGTMQCVYWEQDGSLAIHEIPVFDTFEIRGERFGLILDLDYFVDWDSECEPAGDCTAFHLGTGVRATLSVDWSHPGWVKCHVESLWRDSGWRDLNEKAKQLGCPSVRGTIQPLPGEGRA
jgi:hypothetical protein